MIVTMTDITICHIYYLRYLRRVARQSTSARPVVDGPIAGGGENGDGPARTQVDAGVKRP